MKVIQIAGGFGLEKLELAERARPAVGPGQVLVRVRAASLNYRDLMVTLGHYNPRLKLPLVPGSDGAGEVEEVGAGVTAVKPGDRVAGCFFQRWVDGALDDVNARSTLGGDRDGMIGEYAVLEEHGVVKLPAGYSFEEGATLPCAALTAWNALFEAGRLKAGETVLVQGTGGVSMFALQFARMAGARVIATSSSPEKLERARALGANETVNYKSEVWDARARELTGGIGVDHIVEVGGASTLAQSFKAVRRGGTISVIGVLAGNAEVNPMPVLMRGLVLHGIFVGSQRMFRDMNRAIELAAMKPVIDRTFALGEARAAFEHMQAGRHFGKIVIRID